MSFLAPGAPKSAGQGSEGAPTTGVCGLKKTPRTPEMTPTGTRRVFGRPAVAARACGCGIADRRPPVLTPHEPGLILDSWPRPPRRDRSEPVNRSTRTTFQASGNRHTGQSIHRGPWLLSDQGAGGLAHGAGIGTCRLRARAGPTTAWVVGGRGAGTKQGAGESQPSLRQLKIRDRVAIDRDRVSPESCNATQAAPSEGALAGGMTPISAVGYCRVRRSWRANVRKLGISENLRYF